MTNDVRATESTGGAIPLGITHRGGWGLVVGVFGEVRSAGASLAAPSRVLGAPLSFESRTAAGHPRG